MGILQQYALWYTSVQRSSALIVAMITHLEGRDWSVYRASERGFFAEEGNHDLFSRGEHNLIICTTVYLPKPRFCGMGHEQVVRGIRVAPVPLRIRDRRAVVRVRL